MTIDTCLVSLCSRELITGVVMPRYRVINLESSSASPTTLQLSDWCYVDVDQASGASVLSPHGGGVAASHRAANVHETGSDTQRLVLNGWLTESSVQAMRQALFNWIDWFKESQLCTITVGGNVYQNCYIESFSVEPTMGPNCNWRLEAVVGGRWSES